MDNIIFNVHGTNCKGNFLLMCTRYQLYRQLSVDVYTVPTIQATFCWCVHGTNYTGNFLLMCTRHQLYRQLSVDVYTVPTIQATFCWCVHGTNYTGNFLSMCTRHQLYRQLSVDVYTVINYCSCLYTTYDWCHRKDSILKRWAVGKFSINYTIRSHTSM